MPKEIERKFLVARWPDVEPNDEQQIRQIYTSISPEDAKEERVRRTTLADGSQTYERTVKQGRGMERDEQSVPISAEDFAAASGQGVGRPVEKSSFIFVQDNRNFELRQYDGWLAGLEVVEVEFPSQDEATAFVPPDWFGREVTGDRRFSDASIALNGIPLVYFAWQDKTFNIALQSGDERAMTLLAELIGRHATGQHTMIGIVGGSASGKSRKAQELVAALGDRAMIVQMDSYYHNREWFRAMAAAGFPLTFDEPEAIDLDQLRQDILALVRGESVRIPQYTYGQGKTVLGPPVEPKPIIIVDGLFTLQPMLVGLYDLTLYIDIDRHGRVIRRLLRDVKRSGQSLPEIIRYFGEVVEPMHDRYVVPAKNEADLVMANPFQPAVEASRSGSHELQVKFKIDDGCPSFTADASSDLGSRQQTDWYYSPSDHDLNYHGEMIRIRSTNGPSETPEYLFTYKGPKQVALWRKRAKLEFELDAAAMAAFLSLYGQHVTVVEKHRHLYQFGAATVVIDDAKLIVGDVSRNLGRFVEFRTTAEEMSEEELTALVRRCGFDPADGITTCYIDM